MAVAGSLQVIYERVFGQQHRGWRDVLRFVTWAGVLFGVLVTESVISKPVHAAGGPVAQGLVTYAGTAAFFWWTMHFLLAGQGDTAPQWPTGELPSSFGVLRLLILPPARPGFLTLQWVTFSGSRPCWSRR